MKRVLLFTAVFVAVGMILSMHAATAGAQVSGAIFTTDKFCDGTDLNLYPNKKAVYLDGGPRKVGSAGLPDGTYYVKVTEPNGTLLGTTVGHPSDETPAIVINGEFQTCYQYCPVKDFEKFLSNVVPLGCVDK